MHVQEVSQTDQGRPNATSNEVPRATCPPRPDTHTCRARASRAWHAKRTAATASAARMIPKRSSCYSTMKSTRDSILMSSAPAELVAVLGDLTCAGGFGFEDGLRAILVTASAILLIVGSSSELPTTSGDGLTVARPSSRLIAAAHKGSAAVHPSTHVAALTLGEGGSASVNAVQCALAFSAADPLCAGG